LAASGQFQTILFKDLYCNLIGNVPWQPQGNSKPFSLRNGINFDRKWSLAASAGALVLERRLPARNLDQRFFNFFIFLIVLICLTPNRNLFIDLALVLKQIFKKTMDF